MNKKYLLILAIVIMIGAIAVSVCAKQSFSIALSPYIDFEATVVSVSLDYPDGYTEGGEIFRAPRDSAIVRIEKIFETSGPLFDWASMGIEEGKEVSLDFKYGVRPAKILTLGGETTRQGDAVSHTIVSPKIAFENNYFVFIENGNSKTETILPGLRKGSKFRTRLWSTYEVKVGKYKIVF